MKGKNISTIDLLIETHLRLERQGPGSSEMTIKALNFLDNLNQISRVLDVGCGTGGQTMVLAQNVTGSIIGIDQFPDFINIFNDNTRKLNLAKRVNGIVAQMEDLPFQKEEFDLIWSEGVLGNVEKGLNCLNNFIKKSGYIVVTCPSWFTDERPEEIEKFWVNAGESLYTIGDNIGFMQKAGYHLIAAFSLPEKCWDNYYIPREAAEKEILEKHPENQVVEDYIKNSKYEIELYSKYKQYYGYVFYIGKKL